MIIKTKLNELKAEKDKQEIAISELQKALIRLNTNMIKIEGKIEVLEDLLKDEPEEDVPETEPAKKPKK